jgi:2-polyprenyl-3-methyl-5-hydroxy-6-metoxy-1,4-benzoquinol methylase
MAHEDRIEQHFDERAARYHNPVTDFMGERELRVIRTFVPEGSHVLDYGCGSGRATLDHLRRGCDVTAYDLSREMLGLAQRRAGELGVTAEFTADEAALAGRTWPLVTCIGVLDYYTDPQPLLAALRTYLAPGGRLVVTWPNAASPLGQAYRIGSAMFTLGSHPRSAASARRACEAAGLTVEELRYAAPSVRGLAHTLVLALSCR